MTKVYNVSQYGIAKQIESKLENINDKNKIITNNISSNLISNLKLKNYNLYLCPSKEGDNILINNKDIFKIAEIINNQIFIVYPSLNNIYNYFIDIAKIMVKLGIPITWFTPNGLKITQHYLKNKEKIISTSLFNKTKKMVIREYFNEIDSRKQSNAIIPNIIHSLDATHLINLINNTTEKGFNPIITIHDCFGTHPNKMEELIYLIKKEFILLYSQENFLEKFHSRIIQSIKDNNYNVIFNKEENNYYVDLYGNYIKLPNIPKLGNLDLQKIMEVKYIVN